MPRVLRVLPRRPRDGCDRVHFGKLERHAVDGERRAEVEHKGVAVGCPDRRSHAPRPFDDAIAQVALRHCQRRRSGGQPREAQVACAKRRKLDPVARQPAAVVLERQQRRVRDDHPPPIEVVARVEPNPCIDAGAVCHRQHQRGERRRVLAGIDQVGDDARAAARRAVARTDVDRRPGRITADVDGDVARVGRRRVDCQRKERQRAARSSGRNRCRPRHECIRHGRSVGIEHAQVAEVRAPGAVVNRIGQLEAKKRLVAGRRQRLPRREVARRLGVRGRQGDRQQRRRGASARPAPRMRLGSAHVTSLRGGTGATYPMMSSSTPTPMKDTMRSTPPTCDRSTKNNLATTTANSAAPATHAAR